MSLNCPHCNEDSGVLGDYRLMFELVTCQHCGKVSRLEYDETFDGEEERQYWWLEVPDDSAGEIR